MIVKKRVPFALLQFLYPEDLVIEVVLEQPDIHAVRAGEFREIVELLDLLAHVFRAGEFFRDGVIGVIGEPVIEPVIAKLRRVFGIRLEQSFDVILGRFLEAVVLGSCERRYWQECRDKKNDKSWFHK